MKNKIEEMIYEFNMEWYNFRNRVVNRLTRWCMGRCYPEYFTIIKAMGHMTDFELQCAVDEITAWRKEHPEKNFWEIC